MTKTLTPTGEARLISRARKALAAGDPQPLMDLGARGILPTDAPLVQEAWAMSEAQWLAAQPPLEVQVISDSGWSDPAALEAALKEAHIESGETDRKEAAAMTTQTQTPSSTRYTVQKDDTMGSWSSTGRRWMVVDEDLGDPQATGLTKAQAEAEALTWNGIEDQRVLEDRGEVPLPQGLSLEDLTLTPAPALQEALDEADAAIQADPEGAPFVEHLRAALKAHTAAGQALKPSAPEKAAARKALKEAQEDAQVAAILDQVPALRKTKAQVKREAAARKALGLPPIQAEVQKAPRTTRKAAQAQAQVEGLERQCHGLPKRGVEAHLAPITEFGSNAGTKDGLSNQCRACNAKYRELKAAQGLVRVPTQPAQEAAQAAQA